MDFALAAHGQAVLVMQRLRAVHADGHRHLMPRQPVDNFLVEQVGFGGQRVIDRQFPALFAPILGVYQLEAKPLTRRPVNRQPTYKIRKSRTLILSRPVHLDQVLAHAVAWFFGEGH